MTQSVIITAQIDATLAANLERLAAKSGYSPDRVIQEALVAYVGDELELLDSLDESERQIDRGEYYTQEEMEAWVASLRRPEAAE